MLQNSEGLSTGPPIFGNMDYFRWSLHPVNHAKFRGKEGVANSPIDFYHMRAQPLSLKKNPALSAVYDSHTNTCPQRRGFLQRDIWRVPHEP